MPNSSACRGKTIQKGHAAVNLNCCGGAAYLGPAATVGSGNHGLAVCGSRRVRCRPANVSDSQPLRRFPVDYLFLVEVELDLPLLHGERADDHLLGQVPQDDDLVGEVSF